MAKFRVPIIGASPGRAVYVDDTTSGLSQADLTSQIASQVAAAIAAQPRVVSSMTTAQGYTTQQWSLLQGVPALVLALIALTGSGLVQLDADGDFVCVPPPPNFEQAAFCGAL